MALAMVMCLLSGCGSEEEIVPEVVEPDLTTRADECEIFGIPFQSIGPVCGYVISDDSVEIHPYYNSSEHITVERILLSDRAFWSTIKESLSDSAVIVDGDEYSLLTTAAGVTYAYIPVKGSWALMLKSEDLPSYYVKAVVNKLCKQDI